MLLLKMKNNILTPEAAALADKITQERYNIPSSVLMERAALSALNILEREFDLGRVLIVCGTGNNGGDGLALARLLHEINVPLDIHIVGRLDKASEGFKNQYKTISNLGLTVIDTIHDLFKYTTVVDAIFGISLNRNIEGPYYDVINMINNAKLPVLSLDMPSGIHAGTGHIMNIAVKATITVSFGFKKIGQLLYPGAEYCGRLICTNIGFPQKVLSDPELSDKIFAFEYEEDSVCLPKRPDYSNKGTFGKLLLVAGSEEICGAAILCGLSAMRAGVGMIRIVTAEANRDTLLRVFPEAMVSTYIGDLLPEAVLQDALDWCDCIAIGPGIGQGDIAKKLVDFAITQNKVPVVADADALNIISGNMDSILSHEQDIIVTPHLGEMARMTGLSVMDIRDHLIDVASDFAKTYDLICVLKDARTVISDPKGCVFINTLGNSGMATAGSGDVLTGIIAALVCRRMKSMEAASLGVAVHGKSGDCAAIELSKDELLARDIIKYIE